MNIQIDHNLTSNDLLHGIKWFGESDLDEQSLRKLEDLQDLLTDTVQSIFFKCLETDRIAREQNSSSAREMSDKMKEMLTDIVKMSTKEEDWQTVDTLFEDFFKYLTSS